MKIEQAKALKVGQIVRCPTDRGDITYTGKVEHIEETVHKNIYGVEYVWVTVAHPSGKSRHVWPSHRLS